MCFSYTANLSDARVADFVIAVSEAAANTVRGAMALYTELSEELEQTNRGVVALYRELDEKSEQLRAASESKNRFWANVSPELRTPLNSIIGLTRLFADPAGGLDSEQLYQVELITKASGTLLDQLPPTLPAIVITGRDVPAPPRASSLLQKDQLTRERLAFAIRRASRVAP